MPPKAEEIVAAIDEAYTREKREKPRAYIGASIIGNGCDAYLSLSMRGFPDNPVDPRLKRIFGLGHHLEDVVVRDLRKAGLTIFEVDGLTGRQYAIEAYGGHFRAHMDGQVIEGADVGGLEVKSMNANKWEDFKKNGVRQSHIGYFLQMQAMMHFGKFPWFLFIAYNKNTSEYWCQIVEYDEMEGWSIEARIENVIDNNAMRVSKDEADWRCRSCFKSESCWGGNGVEMACRTCAFSVADVKAGGWWCQKHSKKAVDVCGDWQRFEPKDKK